MITSSSLGQLADALSKAQGAMKNAKKDSNNPFFKSKYADLASVSDACRAELAANNLAVVQLPTMRDGKLVLEYVLLHSSGEFIGSELEMTPVKQDPQGIGSAITYARRYTLSGLAGVATEDDDGNAASGTGAKQVQRTTEEIPIPRPAAIRKDEPVPAGNTDADGRGERPDLKELQKQAKELLSVKPAILPVDAIENGQAVNFERLFQDALKPHLRKKAKPIAHAWLKRQGIVDGDGNGTAKAILKENFYQVREEGIAYAASLEVWEQ